MIAQSTKHGSLRAHIPHRACASKEDFALREKDRKHARNPATALREGTAAGCARQDVLSFAGSENKRACSIAVLLLENVINPAAAINARLQRVVSESFAESGELRRFFETNKAASESHLPT